MFEFLIATALLIFLILVGMPIAFSIGGTTLLYILMTNPINVAAIPLRMFSGVNSFTLMALPLFMLAAEIMIASKISTKLFDFVRLAWASTGAACLRNILASTIMGSLSGAGAFRHAGLGQVEIEAMKEDGMDRPWTARSPRGRPSRAR
jgi:TRAP-type mannitol/chloroaromatic compound transport system permease large subunit